MGRRAILALVVLAPLIWGLARNFAAEQPAPAATSVATPPATAPAVVSATAVPPAPAPAVPPATAPAVLPATAPAAPTVDFARDIQPILSDNCFVCHGPDSNRRKADLRLDIKEALFAPIDGVAPIVPGKPEESSLFKRITSDDEKERMPSPKSGKKKLSNERIALIKKWIEEGAEWKEHWAYIPPVRPPVPAIAEADAEKSFRQNDIDNFIVAHLKASGLRHSAEADRATLIRRLSLDLIGLPPTAEEVDAFVKDETPTAYDKVVDRLLASPHYGERMAVYWLDLVRFADTIGFHSDNPRDVYPYRDWVIKAFNNNQRFNQFTIEQLAGDMLPNASREQRTASAYNRLLLTTGEGGAQAKEYIAKYGADRVRNYSTVWMGATVGCANCHDHKFDPYSQKDFYRLQAFFADIQEPAIQVPQPELALPSPEQEAALAKNAAGTAEVQKVLATTTPEIAKAQASWEQEYLAKKDATPWRPLAVTEASSEKGATLTVSEDKLTVLSGGTLPDTDTYTIKGTTRLKKITALRVEALPHASLPAGGPGRAPNGNFVLSELDVDVHYKNGPADHALAFVNASASIEQALFAEASPYRKWPASAAIDGDKFGANFGWAVLDADGKAGRPANAVFETAFDVGNGKLLELTLKLKQNLGGQHLLGNFRFSVTDAPRPVRASADPSIPVDVIAVLELPGATRTPAQLEQVAAYYRTIHPGLQPSRDQLASLLKEAAAINAAIPRTLTSISGPPRVTRVQARGDWQDDTGEIVSPGVPHFMKQPNIPLERGATRLDLANWTIARENPLTARVFVNRLWKMFYGQGLAKPLDDLGAQGEWPTHPALLDWLAVEFMDSGWDIKHVVKLMVTSGTYRQSSNFSPELREKDPYNLQLARQAAFRLDAEFVRDNALAVSGLLVNKIGGPSVKPYQPARYWEFLNFPKREYDQGTGEQLHRRGLYTWWQRMFVNPSLLNFDASTREECVAERARSNTPQQALTLMNDPTYVEAARVFAEKICSSGCDDDPSKISWAFKRATAREPAAEETVVLGNLLAKHRAHYSTDKEGAAKVIKAGETPPAKDMDPVELAAWTSVARTILNLHETVTRN